MASRNNNIIIDQFIQVLKQLEINTVFGLVGIPIVTLANAMIESGIQFIAFRNEQAASYAASAYGYLTGKPGVLLVVGGPGLIHSLAGVYNSINNRWPLMVIAGSNDNGSDKYKGGFQELDQLSLLYKYTKFQGRLNKDNVVQLLFESYNMAIQGTFGVTYIDFPGNLIEEGSRESQDGDKIIMNLPQVPKRIKYSPDFQTIKKVCQLINANRDKRILLVIGKGCHEFSNEINTLIDTFNLPFLPTPMAKGIVSDHHPLNVSSARSLVLKTVDLVLVFGARLNWILHFGEPPRWKQDVTFIQCDNNPETLGHNNMPNVNLSLCGDIGLTIALISKEMQQVYPNFNYLGLTDDIKEKIEVNELKLKKLETSQHESLEYHNVYGVLREIMDETRTFMVSEGANTMDKARISFPAILPKTRLDAGTNATMGVGLGYTIAAKLVNRDKDVVLITGDSAFGFSGMEIETLTRLGMGVVIVVMNNSGIYHGNNPGSATKLTENCRYDLVARGLGAQGKLITTLSELGNEFSIALQAARTQGTTTLLNVVIASGSSQSVSFAWQQRAAKL